MYVEEQWEQRLQNFRLLFYLLEFVYHDLKRQSLGQVRSPNLEGHEVRASLILLWQCIYETVSELALPIWRKLLLLLHAVFCEATANRKCCNQSRQGFIDLRCGQALSYNVSLSMGRACSKWQNDELCRRSQLSCCCMSNKERAVPFLTLIEVGVVVLGSTPILC